MIAQKYKFLNILIKLMTIVSVVFAGFVLKFGFYF